MNMKPLSVLYDGSSNVVDIAVNELGKKGGETANEHNLSGPYYLEMNSECSWRVTVKS